LKVVLITPGQPSVNPRVVKEADALSSAGHEVTLLYCFWIEWALEADINLLKNRRWNYKLIGGSKWNNRIALYFTKARFKFVKALHKRFGNNYGLAERAQARCYDELLKAAIKIKADWYIGHNLGALAVCTQAATYHNAKAGFDFEDYHRQESESMTKAELNRIIYLERKYVPQLSYFSASSPMILEKVASNFSLFDGPTLSLMNCFPLNQQPVFKEKANDNITLQLFWFSQTVGRDRGLELVLKAVGEINDPNIHLTFAGRVNEDFLNISQRYKSIQKNIHFAGIIPPDDLPAFASNFDVGLAVELKTPPNHNICLANKIFTYLLAGNALILSDTKMQIEFNNHYKVGQVFHDNNVEQLKEKILFYKEHNNLNEQRHKNYQLAKEVLNWDTESRKLINVIQEKRFIHKVDPISNF